MYTFDTQERERRGSTSGHDPFAVLSIHVDMEQWHWSIEKRKRFCLLWTKANFYSWLKSNRQCWSILQTWHGIAQATNGRGEEKKAHWHDLTWERRRRRTNDSISSELQTNSTPVVFVSCLISSHLLKHVLICLDCLRTDNQEMNCLNYHFKWNRIVNSYDLTKP